MNSKDIIWVDNEDSYARSKYQNKINLLAKALKDMLVADGVILKDSEPNGPELLLAVEDYITWKNK